MLDNKEIDEKIFNLNLGKFNNKTKLFESVSKGNWWRGLKFFNKIKYGLMYSNVNNLYYKKIELEYLYEGLITLATLEKTVNILKRPAEGYIHDINIRYNPIEPDKTPLIDFFI